MLRAEIAVDPWRLAFVDADGIPVLVEHRGTGDGPAGTLGFRVAPEGVRRHPVAADDPAPDAWADDDATPPTWRHALRATRCERDGDVITSEVETTDPTGRTLRVRAAPAGEATVAVVVEVGGETADVEVVGIAFEAQPGERFFGFGERSHGVDQRGRTVEHWVGEGPYQLEEYEVVRAIVPPWSIRQRRDATYYPIPWMLSSRGYGVLLDNTELAYHRLCRDDDTAWSVEVWARRLAFRVFGGPAPVDALRRFTEATGRQPFPAAPWFLGPWFQTGHLDHIPLDDERRYVQTLRRADAPASAAETHMRHLPAGAHVGRRDGERRRSEMFHSNGLACLTYFNPWVSQEYEAVFAEAASHGLLQRTPSGDPYTYTGYVGGRADPTTVEGQFDFTLDAARELYGRLVEEALEDGFDGWMEDFGEATPLDSLSANGMTGEEMHNPYPVDFHGAVARLCRDAPRPVARFVRSGWTGAAPHVPIVWGGDPTTTWGFDGLASAVVNALTIGLSGVAVWGSDIGGFCSFGEHALTPELLIRWIQFGALCPVMRTKSEGIAIPEKRRPQIWEPEILPHWRRWAKLHTQLNAYLLGAAGAYTRSGAPIVRHLVLEWPDDPAACAVEDQYLLGPDLLVAPVLRAGAVEHPLYLPPGTWIDAWRTLRFDEGTGGLVLDRAPVVLTGPGRHVLPAPLAEAPLLVRAGAVLPLLWPDVATLADYGASGVVRRCDRDDRMQLLAFPRRRWAGGFNRDEHLESREVPDGWELRVGASRPRRYRLQASLATLDEPFVPGAIEIEGGGLEPGWAFDPATSQLEVTFESDGVATLVVRR